MSSMYSVCRVEIMCMATPVCVYVCACVYMSVCMCMYCMYVCMCICVCMYVCLSAYQYVFSCVCFLCQCKHIYYNILYVNMYSVLYVYM